jgi:hypothetical protein
MLGFHRRGSRIARAASVVALVAIAAGCQQAEEGAAVTEAAAPRADIPDFYNSGYGWVSRQANISPPPAGTPGAHGPVGDHPDFPHYANNSGRPPTLRIGDDTSPLLQPWAAAKVREANAKVHAGGVPFTASNRCWPAGVPGVLGLTAEPVVFFQTPNEVTIIYQRNQTVRHVYLNAEHPENLTPSWLGHSIGHYEGDTLVVDTVGLNDKTYMDNFPIPHSDQLHVIERYRIVPGSPDLITDMPRPNDDERFYKRHESQVLQVIATIEDPGAFTEPFSIMQLYEPESEGGLEESICQAGEEGDRFNQGLVPVPTDETPDF